MKLHVNAQATICSFKR